MLNFVLEIEAQNPDAGEDSSDSVPLPKESVSQIFHNYIYGNIGNVASGHSISQSATMTVRQGDFPSLVAALKSQGVEDEDLGELKAAVTSEPSTKGESFGPKVSSWMGKMVSKAAEGTWKIGTGVAANLLSGYLKAYYGM